MTSKAKYIGPDDMEYKHGKIYNIFPIAGISAKHLVAAENNYGEAYVMPAELFEVIKEDAVDD